MGLETGQDRIRHIADVLSIVLGGNINMKVRFGPKGEGSHWDPISKEYVFDSEILNYSEQEALGVICHEFFHEVASDIRPVMDLWPELGFSFAFNAVEDPRANQSGMGIYTGTHDKIQAYIERDLGEGGGLDYKNIKKDSTKKLGYVPKFMQAGAEFIRYWHDGEFTGRFSDAVTSDTEWNQFLSEIPDSDVRNFIEHARDDFDEFMKARPTSMDKDERTQKAYESADIFRKKIWPEYQKLVDKSLDDHSLVKMIQDMMKKRQQQDQQGQQSQQGQSGGQQGMPIIIPFDMLPKDVQDEIIDMMEQQSQEDSQNQQPQQGQQGQSSGEQGQEGQGEGSVPQQGQGSGEQGQEEGQQGQQGQSSGEQGQEEDQQGMENGNETGKEGSESSSAGGAGQGVEGTEQGTGDEKQDGNEGAQSGASGTAVEEDSDGNGSEQTVPWDKLSQKTKDAVKKLFDDDTTTPKEKKEDYRNQAEKELQDTEDEANQKLQGDSAEGASDAKSHAQQKEDAEAQASQEQSESAAQAQSEANQRARDATAKASRSVREMPSTIDIVGTDVDPYVEYLVKPDVESTIRRWKLKFRPLFQPTESPEQIYRSQGSRVKTSRAMQYAADKRKDRVYLEKGRPVNPNYRFSFLIDMSGSMGGKKIKETFKAVVALTEMASIFGFECEIIGFSGSFPDTVIVYKDFSQKHITNQVREKIGRMLYDCEHYGGSTPTYEATQIAYARLLERNKRRLMEKQYFITLTDGDCTSCSNIEMHKKIERIRKERKAIVIGLGLGPGTEFVNSSYPLLPERVRKVIARKLGKDESAVSSSYSSLDDFNPAFTTIVEAMIKHPELFYR